jgi:hypothetical protein
MIIAMTHLFSSSLSSASDNKTASKERSVITRKDVHMIRSLGGTWQSESDVLMAMRHLTAKDFLWFFGVIFIKIYKM